MFGLVKKYRRLRRAEQGMAYVEFAVTLPFLMLLLLGAIEVTRYIVVVQKVEKTAVTIADLVAQSEQVDTADLDQIMIAATQVMKPYTFGAQGYVIVSSVTKNGTNPAIVNWQYTGGGTWTHSSQVGAPGYAATLPSGFTMTDKENAIFTEVYYNFSPLLTAHGILPASQQVYKVSIFRPRLGELNSLGS